MLRNYGTFTHFHILAKEVVHSFIHSSDEVDVGEWQSIDVSGKPEMITRELANTSLAFKWQIEDDDVEGMQKLIPANQPWAETHFQERIGGEPVNPPPSHKIWPYAQADNEQWVDGDRFSHTYPERMWPKFASVGETTPSGRQVYVPHLGIRFIYGDLLDVVSLLADKPLTRQAFLPIWFPEDTGVVHGERVPCTLGYHFMIRKGYLTVTYYIRSCDFRRHFADDLYMAARLAQWVSHNLSAPLQDRHGMTVQANAVIMHIASFHIFQGDLDIMRYEVGQERFTPNKVTSSTAQSSKGQPISILNQSIMDGLG